MTQKTIYLDLPETIDRYIVRKIDNRDYVVGYLTGDNTRHTMPQWMSPKMHLIIEDIISKLFPFSIRFNLVYHILMGLNCGYSMKEILVWIRDYGKT